MTINPEAQLAIGALGGLVSKIEAGATVRILLPPKQVRTNRALIALIVRALCPEFGIPVPRLADAWKTEDETPLVVAMRNRGMNFKGFLGHMVMRGDFRNILGTYFQWVDWLDSHHFRR